MAFLLRAIGGVEEVHPAHGRPMFSLKELQAFVGGSIEVVRTVERAWWLVLNEDGKALDLPRNARATVLYHEAGGLPSDVVVGDVVLANSVEMGEDEDDEVAAP
jgi:hypothetical protein